jgi:predicted metal-dependent hydrolase
MNEANNIEIDGIGPVLFEHSSRARRIIISVHPQKGVRVAIPRFSSLTSALEFVRLKKPWVLKHLDKYKQYRAKNTLAAKPLTATEKTAAKKEITTRLEQLAKKYGFTYNRVFIRNQKTRWGSCSSKNNISLNVKLMLLPERFINYVILHELVHMKVHNHSKRFWAELDKYVANSKALATELRKKYDLRWT